MGGTGVNHFWTAWTSDYSIAQYKPPKIVGVDVKCAAGASTVATNNSLLTPNTRSDGLLLGTGDTIHLHVSQPAGVGMTLLLDTLSKSAGADFDMYASASDDTPDSSSYAWKSTSGLSNEAIRIPAAGTARTIYIAVRSYAGSGHFRLHPLLHSIVRNLSVCRVGFPVGGPTGGDLASMRAHLRLAAARLVTVTNGNLVIGSYTDGGSPATCTAGCGVCLYHAYHDPLDPLSPTYVASFAPSVSTCGVVHIPRGNWELANGVGDSGYTGHELVHSCLNQEDEYYLPPNYPSTPSFCGHTILSNADANHGMCSLAHCDTDDDSLTPAVESAADYVVQRARACNAGSGWSQFRARFSATTLRGPSYWQNTATADPSLYGANQAYVEGTPVAF